uniref:Odorant-binding protein 57e1 n=1 Tax=Drosophila constricta TaxID=94112 RepID=B0M2F2_9MUSC|nr:odorant-binding protein 57e1 [Drosophila constricta]
MLDRLTLYIFVIILRGTDQGYPVDGNPCTTSNELDEDATLMVLETWPDNQYLQSYDHHYKCFITCLLMNLGLINGTGHVQIDKYVKSGVLDWQWVANELAPCRFKFQDEADMCEFVFGIFHCYRERKLAAEKNGK